MTMMVQGDMLAYHADGELPQLGLSDPALYVAGSSLQSLWS